MINIYSVYNVCKHLVYLLFTLVLSFLIIYIGITELYVMRGFMILAGVVFFGSYIYRWVVLIQLHHRNTIWKTIIYILKTK